LAEGRAVVGGDGHGRVPATGRPGDVVPRWSMGGRCRRPSPGRHWDARGRPRRPPLVDVHTGWPTAVDVASDCGRGGPGGRCCRRPGWAHRARPIAGPHRPTNPVPAVPPPPAAKTVLPKRCRGVTTDRPRRSCDDCRGRASSRSALLRERAVGAVPQRAAKKLAQRGRTPLGRSLHLTPFLGPAHSRRCVAPTQPAHDVKLQRYAW